MYKHIFSVGAGLFVAFLIANQAFALPIAWVLSFDSVSDGGVVSTIDTANDYATARVNDNFDAPQSIVISADNTKAYIADRDASKVLVIDTDTQAVLTSISVVNDGTLAVLPDGTKGYISGGGQSNAIYVLDFNTGTVSDTIYVTKPDYSLALTPDGTKLYVSNAGTNLYTIDTVTNDVSTTTVSLSLSAAALAVSPDGETLYVPSNSNSKVYFVSATTSTIVQSVTIGGGPEGIAIVPDGSKVYVSNSKDGSVSVISTATAQVIATINLGADKFPLMVAVSPDGKSVFVSMENEANGQTEVAIIDVATDSLTNITALADDSGVFSIGVVDRGYSSAGSGVAIYPSASSSMVFESITSSGDTIVASTTTAPMLPEGFKLNDDSIFFDITSTAVWSGTTTICFIYTDDTDEESLQFLHEEGGSWVDRTSSLNTTTNTICADVTSFSLFAVAVAPPIINVAIDIKPGSTNNTLNLGSNGNLPVVIFGSSTFDASKIEPTSVTLANASIKLKGKGVPQFTMQDANNDGFMDMKAHIDSTALGLTADANMAVLNGATTDGVMFTGTDFVTIVP